MRRDASLPADQFPFFSGRKCHRWPRYLSLCHGGEGSLLTKRSSAVGLKTVRPRRPRSPPQHGPPKPQSVKTRHHGGLDSDRRWPHGTNAVSLGRERGKLQPGDNTISPPGPLRTLKVLSVFILCPSISSIVLRSSASVSVSLRTILVSATPSPPPTPRNPCRPPPTMPQPRPRAVGMPPRVSRWHAPRAGAES